MEQLVQEVNGVKTINFELVEEHYGSELVKEIKEDIDFCVEEKHEWKLEVLEDNEYFITFAFVTKYYTRIYEVSNKRKDITKKYTIGRTKYEKIINLMDSLQ